MASLTTQQVINLLTELVQQYPEFGDTELQVQHELGTAAMFVQAVETANGPWLIIEGEV